MMPPGPDPDSPAGGASPVTGLASATHCGGSVVKSAPKPQYPAGERAATDSATSYPGGKSARRRRILAGVTWMPWLADDSADVDAGVAVGVFVHAVTQIAAKMMNDHGRTPVVIPQKNLGVCRERVGRAGR